MNTPLYGLAFYGLAALTLFSAAIATFHPNIFKSACGLFFALFGIAGLFALLGADFLAVTQVVVYVGGILTLILFGVLLTNPLNVALGLSRRTTYALAAVGGALALIALLGAVFSKAWAVQPAEVLGRFGPTTREIGHLLLGRYLLPFEVSSVTLLIALIGAAYLVRRRDT